MTTVSFFENIQIFLVSHALYITIVSTKSTCINCIHILLGVLEMVAVATNNRNVGNIISQIAWRIQNRGVYKMHA